MAKIDTYHTTNSEPAFAITVLTGTQEVFGGVIDTYKTESVQFIGHVDQLSSGTYTVEIQEDDDSGFSSPADVASDFVLGSPMVFTSSDPDGSGHIGYVGHKRYVRVKINAAAAAGGASIGITALVSFAYHNPIEGAESPVA